MMTVLLAVGSIHSPVAVEAQRPLLSAGGSVREERLSGGTLQQFCAASRPNPNAFVSETCVMPNGGVATFTAESRSSGVMRAYADMQLRNPTSFRLGAGRALMNTAAAFFTDRLVVLPSGGPGNPVPSTINTWWNFGGQLRGSQGTWPVGPRPTVVGQFNMIYDPGGPNGMNWGGTFNTVGTADPNVRFIGSSTVVPNGLFVNQSGVVGFLNQRLSPGGLGAGFLDFTVSLQAAIGLHNLTGRDIDVIGSSTFGEADFANTATLAGVEVFDDRGRDITAAHRFQLSDGTVIVGGIPTTVPEPSALALLVGCVAAIAVLTRPCAKRSTKQQADQ